jgi:hypothetical protein
MALYTQKIAIFATIAVRTSNLAAFATVTYMLARKWILHVLYIFGSLSAVGNVRQAAEKRANPRRELNNVITSRYKVLLWYVRFEVFTAATMKNGVFWDATLCGSCKNRRFGGT